MPNIIHIKKKPVANIEERGLLADFREGLGIAKLEGIAVYNRYETEGLSPEEFERAVRDVFSDSVSEAYERIDFTGARASFAYAYLPGQYDQRADSAEQCIRLFGASASVKVKTAKVVLLYGDLTDAEVSKIKGYLINPVDSEEIVSARPPAPSAGEPAAPDLAMSAADFALVKKYFEAEGREPTETEIKVLDTYWSDHCRHTTFGTELSDIKFEDSAYGDAVRNAFARYLEVRREVYGDFAGDGEVGGSGGGGACESRPVTLMDIATIGAKYLKRTGDAPDIDESEEVNACSINAKVNGEDYLIMFKNETHNHPTEIEPFGGAATCLGGAIRDPLSGRAYVYQAMRITGAADPTAPFSETIPGKLSQRQITRGAAQGYSSYGNQIGIATGLVHEIYDEGYAAKRMEVGAVIGAAPKKNVVRKRPAAGDAIVLLGGRTGRDGIGGAVGSSKSHTEETTDRAGAEVQKGNPVTERAILRMFRRAEVARLIKRCNDFGAGGVAVAVGELADGIDVDLDAVPKKYEGLSGTELAISESQERMAICLAPEDLEKFINYAEEENLEATKIAEVTSSGRFRMFFGGEKILDLSREFLNTNGARREQDVFVAAPEAVSNVGGELDTGGGTPPSSGSCVGATFGRPKNRSDIYEKLNTSSQEGLIEMFDSTIGAGTVLMPLEGEVGMVSKVPVESGETDDATVMTFGENVKLAKENPFLAAKEAVKKSYDRAVRLGADKDHIYFSFQEYFEKLGSDPKKWGVVLASLLGAFEAQLELRSPAIGGKDSMSGSYEDMAVPPTLISFAVGMTKASRVKPAANGAEKNDALKGVFPLKDKGIEGEDNTLPFYDKENPRPRYGPTIPRPRVFIPVFPGTNCETDSARAFENAGAKVSLLNVRNLRPELIEQSVLACEREIREAQMLMLPGGFSLGDEPDGSAKFIVNFFKEARLAAAISDLVEKRFGLVLGICNGFQALIKLGLLDTKATLTYNSIGRHISKIVKTRARSNLSPWLANAKESIVYNVPISHGEGRLAASESEMAALIENGQVATQYVSDDGLAMSGEANPNGSAMNVEGITSLSGRVFGKMGHSERIGENLYKNVPGEYDMGIFKAGVEYYN